jgi:Dyp-type peroxidase family
MSVVYSEIGNVRPDAERGHEHFGFRDGVSQPGIRGLTPRSNPTAEPDQGLPGQDLIWPGQFVFSYSGQDPNDPIKPAPPPAMAAPWLKNCAYMVFRRLEQKVPEFSAFGAQQAAALGMDSELLASRMVGRWRSGAPLELTPLQDDTGLGPDATRNNNFVFGNDPFQRACPYAAHIRKTNPRDDIVINGKINKAAVQIRRIIRAGIPFGPEVGPAETTTTESRDSCSSAIRRRFLTNSSSFRASGRITRVLCLERCALQVVAADRSLQDQAILPGRVLS